MQGTENSAETCHKLKKSAHVMGLSGHHAWIHRLLFVLGAFSLSFISHSWVFVFWVFLVCYFTVLVLFLGSFSKWLVKVANQQLQPIAYPAETQRPRSSVKAGLGAGAGAESCDWLVLDPGPSLDPHPHPKGARSTGNQRDGGRSDFMFTVKHRVSRHCSQCVLILESGLGRRKKPQNYSAG